MILSAKLISSVLIVVEVPDTIKFVTDNVSVEGLYFKVLCENPC